MVPARAFLSAAADTTTSDPIVVIVGGDPLLNWVVAVATVIGALGAAGGAIAAAVAARASSQVSRDTADALALTIRPEFLIGLPLSESVQRERTRDGWTLRWGFWNSSPFDARDVDIEAIYKGKRYTTHYRTVRSTSPETGLHDASSDAVITITGAQASEDEMLIPDKLTLRYSDARGIARWEIVRDRGHWSIDHPATPDRGPYRIDR